MLFNIYKMVIFVDNKQHKGENKEANTTTKVSKYFGYDG